MSKNRSRTPVRVGVFSTIAEADHAVHRLLDDGFTKEQLTVVTSKKAHDAHKYFEEYETQEPAGHYTPKAAATGGAIGAVLGGLSVVAGAASLGTVPLLASAGIAAWSGGVFGGLVGALTTRGVEKEVADYYNQAVEKGKVLVAVEDEEAGAEQRLAKAERILDEAGAEPIALREG